MLPIDDEWADQPFDENLVGYNPKPFAAYAEPEGYARVAAMRRSDYRHHRTLTPETWAMAEAMYSSLNQTARWGKQRADGDWTTETAGYFVRFGRDEDGRPRKRPCQPLTPRTIARHFLGLGYAVGATDAPIAWDDDAASRRVPSRVSCLRIDVDMDWAWAYGVRAAIVRELQYEAEIAEALGLTFRAATTGNRGHQIVLPLPAPVGLAVADWLLRAFLRVLVPMQKAGRQAKADVDSLRAVLRLPGGLHAKSGCLGLWVNPEDWDLYPLENQVVMMRDGLRLSRESVGEAAWKQFVTAAAEMRDYFRSRGIPTDRVLPADSRDGSSFDQAVADLPENLFAVRYQTGQNAFKRRPRMAVSAPDIETMDDATSDAPLQVDGVIPVVPTSGPLPGQSATEWARGVIAEGFDEGTFWNWISQSGRQGLRAAWTLWGREQALTELLRLAREQPWRTPGEVERRERVIRALHARHRYIPPKTDLEADWTPTDLEAAVVGDVLASLGTHRPIRDSSRASIAAIVLVLLRQFAAERSRLVEISYRGIARTVRSHCPGVNISHESVRGLMTRLVDGEADCEYRLLRRLPAFGGRGLALRYMIGVDLRSTPWAGIIPRLSESAEEV